ncbi:hypothetical protein OsJ_29047 [Oryza sativa Japonica Group]|uniref:Uncharacterized protein n=1 Tax=Oryza sativa subsp. japonica TaxID=39947 RepID=B9G356_ORYSJ|nr:hypothetical protein OsJ_29047 [Oryza sativa Japonica Group]
MDSATGAMGNLLLKLGELAMDEYKLQKGVKRNVEALRRELESMQAALRKVGDVPSDQLDEQVELWARDVRELSYDADDVLDTFMVRVRVDDDNHGSKGMVSKVAAGFLGKAAKMRHDIADEIKGIMERAREVTARRDSAPDIKKVFKDMLLELDKTKNKDIHNLVRDEKQLIDELRDFIQNKRFPHARRYIIVIDDIWDIASWSAIRCALVENNDGSTIIATTRDFDIAEQIGSPHKLKTLPPKSSKKLFYGRIFGSEDKCPQELVEVSGKILKKCSDVPLAIITIAIVLARTRNMAEEWYKVYNSIGYGLGNNHDMKNMRKILSLSYHNLPSHLRTCLLYLSIFPEDYEIERSRLIRMWISEGFIHPEKDGDNLFELADSYFNELINRSLIQPSGYVSGMLHSCRVHDMIHDLIRSLSSKENFVTVMDGILQQTSPASKVRRLSLQNNKLENSTAQTNLKMSQVRSLSIFSSSGVSLLPSLSSFQCNSLCENIIAEGHNINGMQDCSRGHRGRCIPGFIDDKGTETVDDEGRRGTGWWQAGIREVVEARRRPGRRQATDVDPAARRGGTGEWTRWASVSRQRGSVRESPPWRRWGIGVEGPPLAMRKAGDDYGAGSGGGVRDARRREGIEGVIA